LQGIFCSKTISEEFLEHVKNEAVESIKWFIEHNVPEEWKSIMAMIFTNWHMYGPGQVDEWSMFCAVTYCIGIELDEELWPQLNEVMMRIDFDFWNRYLRCDSRTFSESSNE